MPISKLLKFFARQNRNSLFSAKLVDSFGIVESPITGEGKPGKVSISFRRGRHHIYTAKAKRDIAKGKLVCVIETHGKILIVKEVT